MNFCKFLFVFFMMTLPLFGDNGDLDTRIELLKKEVRELRLKENDALIQSQRALRSNTVDFVNDIEWSESYDKMARIKEQELQQLIKEKQEKTGR